MLKKLFTKIKIKYLKAKSDRYGVIIRECISTEMNCIDMKLYSDYWRWNKKCNYYLDKRMEICKQLLKLRGY